MFIGTILLWDSLDCFLEVLLLEFSHLQVNLSFGFLIDGGIDSQLNLFLDVSLNLSHLLSVTINIFGDSRSDL